MPKTIEVQNLSKNFADIKAVNHVSFEACEADVIAILGANGAGKSTLMNILAGVISPDEGKINIFEQDILQNPLFGKENIGFLPEGSPLYTDMTVQNFLNYMAELKNVNKSYVKEIGQTFMVQEVINQKIETLSKGYARRVGLAQAMLANPKILLLDEPTDGLDPNQKEYIRNIIKKISKNKTILISTHLLDDVLAICNRILLINKGEIIADTTPQNILKDTNSNSLEEAFVMLTKGVQI